MLEYFPGSTLIHRLDVRPKVVAFCILTVFLFFFVDPFYNLLFACFATFLMRYIRIPTERVFKLLKPILPIMVIIVFMSGFTYPAGSFENQWANKVMFYGWLGQKLPFVMGGMMFGITLMLRIYSMVLITSVLTFTTPLDQFIQLMRKLRFPQPLTFVIVTSIRFIPTMQKKVDQVFAAQRARGAKFSQNNIFAQIYNYLPVMVPLIVDSLRMSEQLAISMLNRGYGASAHWTALKEMKMKRIDYWAMVAFGCCFAVLVYLRWNGYGSL
ncbi:energy-coupling factor transporter transmembrane protein EcfT [Brevibacillus fluminis]|uniref:Energy-coupling factor transporter transmembrane protein EcfT n=1 Tax=Brevibacillus fluminis TaxID=511487 RepID=A0A3M8D2R2_9BACL|nr:energy-coupling factor transporter transmembrane component T [Brevibacillus fluminis]RNB82356.1 energy-coupling factor transporter transmembrane protein EcfT [Brevibacillus fluminis]